MNPSSCPRLFEVEALRDGRLTGPERGHFERHLATCPICLREAQALDELGRTLRASAEHHGDELHVRRERTRLLAAFDRALVGERRGGSQPRRWMALAGLMALSAGLVLFWRMAMTPGSASLDLVTSSAVFRPDPGARWSRRIEGRRELVVLERGALWIRVPTGPNKLPLLVKLPDGELEDIGTTFSVTVDDGRTTRVAVDEGRVVLRLRERATVAIGAGESWPASSVRASAGPVPPTPLPAESTPPPPSAPPPPSTSPPSSLSRGAEGAQAVREAQATRSKRRPTHSASVRSRATRHEASDGFGEAMAALHAGQARDAAAGFARFSERHPRDARAEDAAYMRVLALRQAGDEAGMKAAAADYLQRYPKGFRRTEVEALRR